MEFNKWLKRKYPKNYQNILDGFKDMWDLEDMFKVQRYRPAIWTSKSGEFSMVKQGQLILANCSKEYGWSEWNGLYEQEHSSDTWLGTYDCRFHVAGMKDPKDYTERLFRDFGIIVATEPHYVTKDTEIVLEHIPPYRVWETKYEPQLTGYEFRNTTNQYRTI